VALSRRVVGGAAGRVLRSDVASRGWISAENEQRFWAGVDESSKFLMGRGKVRETMDRLVRTIEGEGIPYAIVGAMALNEYGYHRVTTDVGVLLTPEGLARFKASHLGRGYQEKFPGSRGLRDTETGVEIDVVLAGAYPGDGQPKPIAFPDPAAVALAGERGRFVPLTTLIELKLASGMTAAHRLKDLADVQELIRITALPEALARELHSYVREKYRELWRSVQGVRDE
jgi:hypothetical protein